MNNKNSKNPRNSKGQHHGYQEWYWKDTIYFKSNYINGNRIGYTENHYINKTTFYIR